MKTIPPLSVPAFSPRGLLLAAALLSAAPGAAAPAPTLNPAPASAPPTPAAAAPDYSKTSAWICRPGQETACTTGLDATLVAADGRHSAQPFKAAANPAIDCFYVYPTASHEASDYADMTLSPELAQVTQAQAGRLTARCRLFAPLYRQLTAAGLGNAMRQGGQLDWSGPYADVKAAWRWYLAHDNAGRGVVLVGHSQGTILLQRLLAEEIDGQPAQKLLVAAFLAGDPSFTVPKGAAVGGTLRHIPLCGGTGQTGCVYVWGSYRDDDTAPPIFGRNGQDGLVGACVSPASPAGGTAVLKTYLRAPAGKDRSAAPFVAWQGRVTGRCVADADGAVLRVTPSPGALAGAVNNSLQARRPGWGLHWADLALVQGNILDDLAAETASWTAARH